MRTAFVSRLVVILFVSVPALLPATEPPPPIITNINVNGNVRNLRFAPYPGAEGYQILSAPTPQGPYVTNFGFALAPYVASVSTNGTNLAYEWRGTDANPSAFYRVQATPMSQSDLLASIVLNRLAYGPTPDELERVKAMGAQAYINEQLNMEGIPETLDTYVSLTTNSVPENPADYWDQVTVTGKLTSSTFYLLLTQPGEVHIDDIELAPVYYSNFVGMVITNNVTNYFTNTFTFYGTNLLANGDFETALTPPWTKSAAASGSAIDNTRAHSGAGSLRLNLTTAGSTAGSNVLQTLTTNLTNNSPVRLSYWYLRTPDSSKLKVQLGGNGLITSGGAATATPTWVYATATGPATATLRLYLFLNGSGDCYVDDVKLVAGTVPETGPNLLPNGDFESGTTTPWQFSPNFTNSSVSTEVARSGNASLHIVATAAGSGSGNSVFQDLTTITNGQVCTLSYWYLPNDDGRTFSARLSGSLLASSPDSDTGGLSRRMNTQQAAVSDLRAWFTLHAVNSKRQLFEILSQFWDNHFVTQYQKDSDYLSRYSYENGLGGRLATDWESRELLNWRNAMLNPRCTFYDLLRISAQSPAMIVYLDTVDSKGSGTSIANENYARELLELFCFGVNNGYDQNDIVLMSRAWTGWSVDIVDEQNINDPLAPISTTYYPYYNSTSKTNTVGRWAFNFKSANHGTNRGAIFPGKTVPARFGPPWAGRSYQLTIPPRTGSSGIQDGYDVIAHLADQPFTQEFLSIKLCRLFVHEGFPNPTTDPLQPEYAFYDYTDPNHSAEAELVHQCMLAWENGSPKGQIRSVLSVIFNSELFQSHAAAAQKVKTPLEFVVSTVRALHSTTPNGLMTTTTDGYAFQSPMLRMGSMDLFNRDAPDGYPEAGSSWISAGTLTERIRFVQSFCIASTGSNRTDAGNNFSDPVALLKLKLPAANWNVAGEVADCFLRILYPGEGIGNLSLYRSAAIHFLDTADDGVTASLFASLGNTSTTYDTRVRGMVAMLMTFQRFQEQ